MVDAVHVLDDESLWSHVNDHVLHVIQVTGHLQHVARCSAYKPSCNSMACHPGPSVPDFMLHSLERFLLSTW